MADDPRRDEDLERALFGDAPEPRPVTPTPAAADDGAIEDVLFGPMRATGSAGTGRAVGYAAPHLPRSRRILVGLGVVAGVVLVVMATVAFASGSPDDPQVRVPERANSTSTSVTLRGVSSLPAASTSPAAPTVETTDTPGPNATTRRATGTTTAPPDDAAPDPEPEPTDPPATEPPPTSPPPTDPTTTTEPPTTTAPCEVCIPEG